MTVELYGGACRPLLDGIPPDNRLCDPELTARRREALAIVAAAQDAEERARPRRHRALADAESLRRTWLGVRERVEVAIRARVSSTDC